MRAATRSSSALLKLRRGRPLRMQNAYMRVFISSVRRGLEVERDALPGLIKAIGHEPSRFEDYTAQAVPSRQACMEGVDQADVYLLMLGPYYGHVFAETGQSATHDEVVRAQTRGIHRLVFVKDGVDMEPKQLELKAQLGDYGSGLFWTTFTGVADLQTKVADALRQLSAKPAALTFELLLKPVGFTWRSDWAQAHRGGYQARPHAELHVKQVGGTPIPTRLMDSMGKRLVRVVRASGIVPDQVGLNLTESEREVVVDIAAPDRSRGIDAVDPASFGGLRLGQDGQASAWWRLPHDMLGAMVNGDNVREMTAQALHLCNDILEPDADARFAVALGVEGTMVTAVDTLASTTRSSASMGLHDEPRRVLPDESVSAAGLSVGASELANELARQLVAAVGRR